MSSSIPNLKPTPAARFITLDPAQSGATPLGRGDVQSVRYNQPSLVQSTKSASVVTLCSFVTNLGPYNVVDFSASPGGLKNNVLYINGTAVTVPPGSYDAVVLAATIEPLVQVIVATATVTYDTVTYRFVFSDAAPFRLSFGATPAQSFAYELGFPPSYDVTTTSHTSPNNVNLSGPSNIYFQMPEFPTGNVIFYDQTPFLFCYPLTTASPYEGQLTMFNTPKLQAMMMSGLSYMSSLTVSLFFTRNGLIYPYYIPGTPGPDSRPGSYELTLALE